MWLCLQLQFLWVLPRWCWKSPPQQGPAMDSQRIPSGLIGRLQHVRVSRSNTRANQRHKKDKATTKNEIKIRTYKKNNNNKVAHVPCGWCFTTTSMTAVMKGMNSSDGEATLDGEGTTVVMCFGTTGAAEGSSFDSLAVAVAEGARATETVPRSTDASVGITPGAAGTNCPQPPKHTKHSNTQHTSM